MLHIAISWDITANGDRWTTLNQQMLEVLKPYSWVRPLSTFYIVQIHTESARGAMHSALESVAKAAPERIHFLISPAMQGGRYDGYLPGTTWPKINERTG